MRTFADTLAVTTHVLIDTTENLKQSGGRQIRVKKAMSQRR